MPAMTQNNRNFAPLEGGGAAAAGGDGNH